MALPPTIHRIDIDISDIDRGRYERLQTTVARHASETAERLATRLLAYALCCEEGLAFTRGIAAGDEPDLWLKGPDGRVRLWVEVGLPDSERLLKAARHAERVVLFAAGSGRARWENANLPRLAAAANVTVFALDFDFVQRLAERLERTVNWSVTVSGGTAYITVDGVTFDSPVLLLAGMARS